MHSHNKCELDIPILIMKKISILNNLAQNQHKSRKQKSSTQIQSLGHFIHKLLCYKMFFLISTISHFLTLPFFKYDIYLIGLFKRLIIYVKCLEELLAQSTQ